MKKPTAINPPAATATVFIHSIPTLNEILHTQYSEPSALVDRLLRPGEITLMIGRQKEGKSTLVLQLAIDIGTGGLFLDEYATHAGKVLIVDFENRPIQIQKRAYDLGKNRDMSNVYVEAYDRASAACRSVSLFGDGAVYLREIIAERQPDVLIIDPLRYAAFSEKGKGGGEEGWAMATIDAIARIQEARPTLAVLCVHHLRKAGEDGGPTLRDDPRSWIEKCFGSQALLAHSDSIWGLACEAEGYTFATVPRSHEQLTIRLEKGPESERFLLCDDRLESLSSQQRDYWSTLPDKFTWTVAIGSGIPKSSLSRIIRQTKANGMLKLDKSGTYTKVEL
jgi:hypothetical protein